jgi:hypothetical protein
VEVDAMAATWSFMALVFFVLMIAACVVIALGFRGRPVFTSPRCARCGYDLRAMNFMTGSEGTCPECGAKLGEPSAVTFGKLQRRTRMIGVGVVLLALALASMVLVPMWFRSRRIGGGVGPQASQARSTPALITSLQATVTQPWDWQELERRLGAGSLTTSDVDATVNVLIGHLNAQRAAGRAGQPVHWLDGFLKLAMSRGDVSPPVLKALCQSFYGTEPRVTMRKHARAEQPIEVEIDGGEPWNLPGMRGCWALRDVKTADGKVINLVTAYNENSPTAKHPDQFSGNNQHGDVGLKLLHQLGPGEHELTFTFDIGTVSDRAIFRGLDGKPGTANKWPTPISTWQATVKHKVTLVAQDQSIVDLVTDPTLDPFQRISLKIEKALARPSSQQGKSEIVITWAAGDHADPPLSYQVTLVAGGERIDFGRIFTGKTANNSSTSNMTGTKVVRSLPPDVKSIDVLFTPDPKNAERFLGVERIWGGEYKIENVPIERFDLAPGK